MNCIGLDCLLKTCNQFFCKSVHNINTQHERKMTITKTSSRTKSITVPEIETMDLTKEQNKSIKYLEQLQLCDDYWMLHPRTDWIVQSAKGRSRFISYAWVLSTESKTTETNIPPSSEIEQLASWTAPPFADKESEQTKEGINWIIFNGQRSRITFHIPKYLIDTGIIWDDKHREPETNKSWINKELENHSAILTRRHTVHNLFEPPSHVNKNNDIVRRRKRMRELYHSFGN